MSETSARLVHSLPVRVLLALGLGSAIPRLRRARRSFQRPSLDPVGQVPDWRYRSWIARRETFSPPLEVAPNIAVIAPGRSADAHWLAVVHPHDELAPAALNEIAHAIATNPDADAFYSDVDEIDTAGHRTRPRFKPAWSPDYLRSGNYVGGLFVVRRELLQRVGAVHSDYDLALKVGEVARKIAHVPKVLVHLRQPRLTATDEQALRDHLRRVGLNADVSPRDVPGTFRVRYRPSSHPRVSVIIPNRDEAEMLERCVASFREDGYSNVDILIVENGSSRPETFALYERLKKRPNVRVMTWEKPFNFAAVNNFAAAKSSGELLLFLNNDVEAVNRDWLDRLVELALLPGVGAVGAKLLYPDGTVQHGGVAVGMHGAAGHLHQFLPGDSSGYMNRLQVPHNVSAVTGACLLMPLAVFDRVGGFDEEFALAYNDIDLCLKAMRAGYRNIWTPDAVLIHHESKTRGEDDTPDKRRRLLREVDRLREKWAEVFRDGDPYFGPHFRRDRTDFCI